jgi:hypothetical protein
MDGWMDGCLRARACMHVCRFKYLTVGIPQVAWTCVS